MPDTLLDELRGIVGPTQAFADPDLVAGYATDWTRKHSATPRLVVRPADTAEVSAVVTACADAGAAIVPQGGNTGLVGGSVPRRGEVVVSLTRLDDLGPVETTARSVVVGAGATLASVQAHAAAEGLAFGVDFASRQQATIGGMVATNAGGMHVLRYGMMRAQVQGIEAVLADGSVARRLGGLPKDNVGYDLPGLLTGSEGTLAILTRVRLRLVPAHRERVAALLAVDGIDEAVALTARLRGALPDLEAAELILEASLRLSIEHGGLTTPFATLPPAALLVECAADDDPTERLAAAVEDAGVDDAVVGVDRREREGLWAYREALLDAIAAEGEPLKLDVTLPGAEMAGFVADVEALLADLDPRCRCYVFGHVGDGNLHVNVLGLADDAAAAAEERILEGVLARGGSVSAEHGIGVTKTRWVPRSRDAGDLAAMRAVKRALDPAGLLNPGVLLPEP